MKFARVYLVIVGAMFILIGAAYLLSPAELIEAGGIAISEVSGVTEVRAMYGGLQIGFGVFLLWAAGGRERVSAGCWAPFAVMGVIALARGGSALLEDHFVQFHIMGLAFEVTIAVLAWIAFRRSRTEARMLI